MRIIDHPILGALEEKPVMIYFNGIAVDAREGDSIAAALLANNIRTLRQTETHNKPRGIYCGIGHCYECRVTVNGERSIRACITTVKDEMQIHSQSEDYL